MIKRKMCNEIRQSNLQNEITVIYCTQKDLM